MEFLLIFSIRWNKEIEKMSQIQICSSKNGKSSPIFSLYFASNKGLAVCKKVRQQNVLIPDFVRIRKLFFMHEKRISKLICEWMLPIYFCVSTMRKVYYYSYYIFFLAWQDGNPTVCYRELCKVGRTIKALTWKLTWNTHTNNVGGSKRSLFLILCKRV